jgi:hypothetical protein
LTPARRAQNKRHQTRWTKRNPERRQYQRAKERAKKKGLEFSVPFAEIIWPEFCPALGVRLARAVRGESYSEARENSPSLDRIDNRKGYVSGNVIVVSFRANRLKSNASLDEMQRLLDFYRRLA